MEQARSQLPSHSLCIGCEAVGRTTLAQCVDHVVPHKGDHDRMWSVENLQPLCHWHHNVVKQRLDQLHAQGLITDADLRIDSPKAVAMTKRLQPV